MINKDKLDYVTSLLDAQQKLRDNPSFKPLLDVVTRELEAMKNDPDSLLDGEQETPPKAAGFDPLKQSYEHGASMGQVNPKAPISPVTNEVTTGKPTDLRRP